LEDECHGLYLELAKLNITHPDDTTNFATYASSLYQRPALHEEKGSLSKLIVTINQVITYLALNLPNSVVNMSDSVGHVCFFDMIFESRQFSNYVRYSCARALAKCHDAEKWRW